MCLILPLAYEVPKRKTMSIVFSGIVSASGPHNNNPLDKQMCEGVMKSDKQARGSYMQWSFWPLDGMPPWQPDQDGPGVGVKLKNGQVDGVTQGFPAGF